MGARMGGGSGWDDSDSAGGFRPVAEINVTPLVDVMLVLLIVFMVAAPLMTVGVPLQLPKSAAAKVAEPKEPLVVSIDKDGKVFLGEEELSEDDVLPRLEALATDDDEQVVLVRGDKTISYGRLMEVMGEVSNAGFKKVSLIAEMAPGGGAAGTPGTPSMPVEPGAAVPAVDTPPTALPDTAPVTPSAPAALPDGGTP